MTRLHIVVEGQTEETFVNRVLAHHVGQFGIWVDARRVETSRHRKTIYRGGLFGYQKARKDLTLWMREDQNADAYFTTMFDLYALPEDFPGYGEAKQLLEPYARVARIEEAFAQDLSHPRFVPYIQLHEFEALLLSDPSKFDWQFIEHHHAIANLTNLANAFASPELINDGFETAPSKRIIREIPEYFGRKASAGPIIAEKIGIDTMRLRCPHFDAWLRKLEALGQ